MTLSAWRRVFNKIPIDNGGVEGLGLVNIEPTPDNSGMMHGELYVMDEKLDAGKIIHQKSFSKPSHIFIDDIFDAHIRSDTMIDVLKGSLLLNENFLKQDPDAGETYFIIHPVLKHIAILSCVI